VGVDRRTGKGRAVRGAGVGERVVGDVVGWREADGIGAIGVLLQAAARANPLTINLMRLIIGSVVTC
jgi:hypothetical protein